MYPLVLLFSVVFCAVERPPNVYKWIEENAHICTSIPTNGRNSVNFLTPEEGQRCSLCPEVAERQPPTSACAVELSPNEVDVDIGCHPLPELCVLEMRIRYDEFFGGGLKSTAGLRRSDESILSATINPFDGNIIQHDPTPNETKSLSVPQSAIFSPKATTPTAPRATSQLRISPNLLISTTSSPLTSQPVLEVDGDSGMTIRADIFASPSGSGGIPLSIGTSQMATRPRLSIPMITTTPTNREILPDLPPPPSQLQIDKRIPKTTKAPFVFTTVSSITPKTTTAEPQCVDTHSLCCWWAIASECDTNPFWMRIHCANTCGTCNCKLKEADKCRSTGINCTVPKTTTTTTTAAPKTTTTTTTTTSQPTTTARLTPPPNRFTAGPRPSLPRWKTKPLPGAAMPPATRPRNPQKSAKNEITKHSSSTTRPLTTLSTTPTITASTPSNCFNFNRLCEFWARLGECRSNPFWMRPNCQRACNSCGETISDVHSPKSKANCSNLHSLCPFWAFIGECAKNARWMLIHCRPSCQVC